VAVEAEAWIHAHFGPAHPWPRNVRELEQCVRNLIIRGHYRPRRVPPIVDPRRAFADAVVRGTLDRRPAPPALRDARVRGDGQCQRDRTAARPRPRPVPVEIGLAEDCKCAHGPDIGRKGQGEK
jgi:hypothetical protein